MFKYFPFFLSTENSYLNAAVPADGVGASTKQFKKPAGHMKDDILDKLELAMKRQIDSFQIDSKRLDIGKPIGSGIEYNVGN